MNQDMRVLKFFLKISALLDLFPKSVFSAFLRPEINFRYGSRSSLLQQTSAYSRAIYRSALKNQG